MEEQRPVPAAVAVALAWSAFGVLNAALSLVTFRPSSPEEIWQVVWSQLSFAIVWAAFTPLVFALFRRFPWRPDVRMRFLAAHTAAAVLVPACVLVVSYVVFGLGSGTFRDPSVNPVADLGAVLAGMLGVHMSIHLEVLAIAWALSSRRLRRGAEDRAARIESQLVAARVASLKAQLDPHFLFNTLNVLMPLITKDPEAAESTLRKLGDLFRMSLASPSPFAPIAWEIDFVSRYLDLQRTRYGPRLTFLVAVEPSLGKVTVPPLLLQPLVENAIRHGVAPRRGPGRVEVRVKRAWDRLSLEVLDDGLGLGAEGLEEGLGLSSTRSRLAQLFGEDQSLVLANRAEGGVSARILIPISHSTGNAA